MPGRPPAARIERATTSAPGLDVGLGVADHGRLAGRAGGGVHAHDLLARHGEQPERIVGAQVGLGGEGELGEIGERVEIVGMHAGGVERLPVVGARCRRRAAACASAARAAARRSRRARRSRSGRGLRGVVSSRAQAFSLPPALSEAPGLGPKLGPNRASKSSDIMSCSVTSISLRSYLASECRMLLPEKLKKLARHPTGGVSIATMPTVTTRLHVGSWRPDQKGAMAARWRS